ncbi:unnamed protein product [Lactuca saligna]|uniref:PB1-like domain-containing protein n=1 Tax=Lactuca saligna TaxID=75948 RepID=A0AA36E0P5_LACSI|nr:unnamed protein product [Lactuca saligna]
MVLSKTGGSCQRCYCFGCGLKLVIFKEKVQQEVTGRMKLFSEFSEDAEDGVCYSSSCRRGLQVKQPGSKANRGCEGAKVQLASFFAGCLLLLLVSDKVVLPVVALGLFCFASERRREKRVALFSLLVEEGSRVTEVLYANRFCVVTNNSRVWRILDVTEEKLSNFTSLLLHYSAVKETDLGFVKHSCDRAERNKELAAMAQSEPNGLFSMVELNYQEVFNRNPFSYTGGVKTIFNDVDFSSMTYSEFVTFCERFMHEECKKFYYCEPDMSFMEGLNPISDDVEYSAFIFDAYGTDGVISVYVDHIGVGVDGWHDDEDNDDDEHESCIDGENEDNIDELRNVAFEFNEDVVHMNRTSNDPFLSKLCVDDEDANNIVDDDNGREVEGSKSEPQQHEEVEMTPIEMDTTQNDMQVAPTDVESSSAKGF